MPSIRPFALIAGNCAIAIAIRAHDNISIKSTMAPMNLRWRVVICRTPVGKMRGWRPSLYGPPRRLQGNIMNGTAPAPEFRLRAIRIWLLVIVVHVFAMVMVGGATRVTGSGLSIVEWKPISGMLPPLSVADWEAEFEKYKAIPQYQQLNRGM